MYFNLLSIVVVTCINAWPTVFLIIPLVWVNLWYRVCLATKFVKLGWALLFSINYFILVYIKLYVNVYLQGYYLANSRELTRLSSITKAPVIHHFSETVSGVMTIRCFRRQTLFCRQNMDKVDVNLKMDFYTTGANEWLGFRLEFIGSVVLCIATLFMIILPSSIIKPGTTSPYLNLITCSYLVQETLYNRLIWICLKFKFHFYYMGGNFIVNLDMVQSMWVCHFRMGFPSMVCCFGLYIWLVLLRIKWCQLRG